MALEKVKIEAHGKTRRCKRADAKKAAKKARRAQDKQEVARN